MAAFLNPPENLPDPGSRPSAFLNIPYDPKFQNLYLSYIAGLCAFGLLPRATLEVPGGERRLDRIIELIQSCPYSFHDLSRVELDISAPRTPRFNMPFELGLSVAWQRASVDAHTWFVLESKNRRVQKSLSDLNGTDVYIHDGKPAGVFRELCNALVRVDTRPDVAKMMAIYHRLAKSLPSLMARANARSPFEARVFSDLVIAALDLSA